jgi:hypothetical protein
MFRRFTTPVEQPAPPDVLQQVAAVLKIELLPLWLFWLSLRSLRPWWPIVLPLLVAYFIRVYRRERNQLARRRAKVSAPDDAPHA